MEAVSFNKFYLNKSGIMAENNKARTANEGERLYKKGSLERKVRNYTTEPLDPSYNARIERTTNDNIGEKLTEKKPENNFEQQSDFCPNIEFYNYTYYAVTGKKQL